MLSSILLPVLGFVLPGETPKPRVVTEPSAVALGTQVQLSAVDATGSVYDPDLYQFLWTASGVELVDGSSWSDPSPRVVVTQARPFEAELYMVEKSSGEIGKGAASVGLLLESAALHGRPTKWHPLELWFPGPACSMFDDAPNPFLDGRLDVTFTRPDKSEVVVPGFFDGDGFGGPAGNVWKVRLSPDAEGVWNYRASFRFGADIAVAADGSQGTPTAPDGATGSFVVAPRDASAPGFLKHGRLEYVGEHYRRFADGPYWIKSGTDSPENLLGFAGFAAVEKAPGSKGVLHRYEPHADDWTLDDPELPLAGSDGGDPSVSRNLIGALNYLSSVGVNAIYCLPMNLGGDGQDVAPFVGYTKTAYDKTHYHLGRLHQWEAVFRHAQELGIQIQFVLAETEYENETWLDDGALGLERKLLYRELVARFGHHLAIKWNLSEENDFSVALLEQKADWLGSLDPWGHGVAVHNKPSDVFNLNDALLGKPQFQHTSIQYAPGQAGLIVEQWRANSAAAGQPWILDLDENNPAHLGAQPDNAEELRKQVLYDVYFSGGQLEWYLGGQPLPIGGDLDLEDFRTREEHWVQTANARRILETLPFHRMQPMDGLVFGETNVEGGAEVFAEPGRAYAVYLPSAASEYTQIDLSNTAGSFEAAWYDPRLGTIAGEPHWISGGSWHFIGEPPSDNDQDWVFLLRRPEFWSATNFISLNDGVTTEVEFEAPIGLAGQPFVTLGNLSGFDPTLVGTLLLPLIPDEYTLITVDSSGAASLKPVHDEFDADGRFVGTLTVPPLMHSVLVGHSFTFVWAAGSIEPLPGFPASPGFPIHVSAPLEFLLVP